MTQKKVSITVDDVKHVATLASLPLSDTLVVKMTESLDSLIDFVGEVQELDLQNVEPTAQVTGKTNEFREDIVKPSLPQEVALSQAPRPPYKGLFVVPRVLQND